jgi:hypothetical protein
MPKFDLPTGFMRLSYSFHALEEAKKDKYGYHGLPDFLDIEQSEVIEVETDSLGKPRKVLYRTSYTKDFDLCLVILINENFVKTVWLNEKDDFHDKINKLKYVQNPCN